MSSAGRILVVDDEPDITTALQYAFELHGYTVMVAHDGVTALEIAEGPNTPELVILDLMLPDMPGTEICRRLRRSERTQHVPVLILSARSEEIDRVVGFEVGADDYVVKPFSTREVMLRVKALLRRARLNDTAPVEESFGPLRLDSGAHRAWVNTEELELTALEFRLLSTFLARRGVVQTRDVLLTDVWGLPAGMRTRTVDTHIRRLRDKLGVVGTYVETVRGVGYRFRAAP
ncbi:MAG: response regulator transcription factor [Bradymonadia bacterium]